MLISRLKIRSFRNIESLDMSPCEGINVVWGDNAQGKTSILESIYLFGYLKSFRSLRTEELILEGETSSMLCCDVMNSGVSRRLSLVLNRQGKEISLDKKPLSRILDLLGILRPVLFCSEEVQLTRGSPAGRRSLLDRAMLQVDPGYLGLAQDFVRNLKQRNSLLKKGIIDARLAPWTEGFIRCAARIRSSRADYLNKISPLFEQAYRNISGLKETASLSFRWAEPSVEYYESSIRSDLERKREQEAKFGMTLCGPHRDDLLFCVNGKALREFGSQGQQRSFILAFKIAQVQDIHNCIGQSPVLLLDDMTSELDRSRRDYLYQFLRGWGGQVFITTTDRKLIDSRDFSEPNFFHISNGRIESNLC